MKRHALLLIALGACAPALPARSVLEHDVGPYRFRRYQEVHDVEFPIADNPAVGHTATYVRGGDNIRVAPVFVTRYARANGLADNLRSQLKALDDYTVSSVASHGAHVYRLVGELGDGWLIWPSGAQLVKLGVPQGEPDVPEALLVSYLEAYPSDLKPGPERKPEP